MNVYANLAQLQIELPGARQPAAQYVPHVKTGQLILLSGHTARHRDGRPWVGQLGNGMSIAEGEAAARSVAVDLLGTLQAAVGDLNQVARLVKLTCMVNASPLFTEHHIVANGASHLLTQVLGDRGRHARSALGVAQLPHGSCVEIEMIAELEPDGGHAPGTGVSL